jgi:phosphonate transport system substrate-binding protein
MKIILSLLLFSQLTFAAKEFKFSAIPDEDTAALEKRFGKVAAYLTKKLGVKTTYVPVKNYGASVQAFTNNLIQLAWFGGLSGVEARRNVKGSKAIAAGIEDLAFVSYFIANTSTGLAESKSLSKDLKGKTFTFGSKGSTSGRLMPEFYLRDKFKQSPDDFFKRVGFSGNHSKTIALVQDGTYEVGATNYKVWEKELEEGKIDTNKVKVIWKTPKYPDYNWSVRGDLDEMYGKGFTKKVTQALLDIKDKDILDAFPREKFVKVTNKMFEPILDTAQKIGLLR